MKVVNWNFPCCRRLSPEPSSIQGEAFSMLAIYCQSWGAIKLKLSRSIFMYLRFQFT